MNSIASKTECVQSLWEKQKKRKREKKNTQKILNVNTIQWDESELYAACVVDPHGSNHSIVDVYD